MKKEIDRIKRYIFSFFIFSLIFCLIASLLIFASAAYKNRGEKETVSRGDEDPLVIVIDAGHGGEDGGASFEGVYEKDINLSVALALEEIFRTAGIKTVMTRSEDILLYDKSSDYQGQKKVQDLATRRRIAEEYENAIFISIHMNSFPEEKYSGLQVYYSKNDPLSRTVAEAIQSSARLFLSPDNSRRAKAADSSIYLLDRLKCPAVMIECGFLSNSRERALLCDDGYRKALALCIASSVIEQINLSDLSRGK